MNSVLIILTFECNYCTDVQVEYTMWASDMCQMLGDCNLL